MYSINEIFQTFGPEYMASFGTSMPNDHKKVIKAIMECRTEACGLVVYECTGLVIRWAILLNWRANGVRLVLLCF